jgi:hypothetical protein
VDWLVETNVSGERTVSIFRDEAKLGGTKYAYIMWHEGNSEEKGQYGCCAHS